VEIYLLRHALAVPSSDTRYPNDDRPLTPEGRRKMERAARGLKALRLDPSVILTSPLIRAADTARLAAEALGQKDRVRIFEPLLPGTPPAEVLQALSKFRARRALMLVGHEPDLGRLAAALLGSEGLRIEFKKGGLCRIDVEKLPPRQPGTLRWHLTPDHLRHLQG